MATAKRLRRQAETCAALAAATYDEESRERYLRLEQLYLHLVNAEEGESELPGVYVSDSSTETATQRVS